MLCKNNIKQYLLQFIHKNGNGYAIANATDPKVAENVFKAQTKYEDARITSITELRWFVLEMQLVEEGSVITYGQSLYDLAVYNGYKGTLLEFMESMRGPVGPEGPLGPPGPSGITEETDPTVPSHVKSITLANINEWNEAEANVQSDWNQTTTTADDYIKNKPDIPDDLSDLNDDSTHRLVTDTEKATWNGKLNALTFDSTPTTNSTNPVTSGGVKTALDAKQLTLVSGTNIKTVNNNTLLGSGNITIEVEDGVGFDDINTPTPVDGTTIISLTNGDTVTLDLNHVHPQYLKYELVSSLPASPDSGTLYLIAAT